MSTLDQGLEKQKLAEIVLSNLETAENAYKNFSITTEELFEMLLDDVDFKEFANSDMLATYLGEHPGTEEDINDIIIKLAKQRFPTLLNENTGLEQLAVNVAKIAENFISSLRKYIKEHLEEIDIEVLTNLAKGINSATYNVHMYRSMEEVKKAKKDGLPVDLQNSQELTDAIESFLPRAINLDGIVELLQSDPTKTQLIIEALLKKRTDYPVSEEGFLQAYLDFKELMTLTGSKISTKYSARALAEHSKAVQLLAHAVTRKHVDDLFPNIFVILADYLTYVMMEADFRES